MTGEERADRAAMAGDYRTALELLRGAAPGLPPTVERALKMAAMARATGDSEAASRYVHEALGIDPLDVSALLVKATILHNADAPDAGEFYGRALAQATDRPLPHLEGPLAVARQRYAQWQHAARADLVARASRVAAITDDLQWFIDAALHMATPQREGPTHYCYPGLPTRGFYDRSDFPWLQSLDANAATIRREFVAVAQQSARRPYIRYPGHVPVDQWRALNGNSDWSAIHLIERGIVGAAARHCPETMALLAALPMPTIDGIGPNAMFSVLAPGTHIPPHTGITNTRLICHLPLVVPPGCWFRVGEERRHWVEDKAWVFDDTVEHEAMNPSDRPRVVLIFDLWHPDLDVEARRGTAAVMQGGRALHAL